MLLIGSKLNLNRVPVLWLRFNTIITQMQQTSKPVCVGPRRRRGGYLSQTLSLLALHPATSKSTSLQTQQFRKWKNLIKRVGSLAPGESDLGPTWVQMGIKWEHFYLEYFKTICQNTSTKSIFQNSRFILLYANLAHFGS